jgi:hypothetical protein
MRDFSIKITAAQEKYLKQFANNHCPGAKDNLATYHPIFAVQKKQYNYMPYSPDIEEYYNHLPLVFGCGVCDKWYKDETELIRNYCRDKEPPMPIKPFVALKHSEIMNRNGRRWVSDYKDYFAVYGIEDAVVAWQEGYYENVAFFFILNEARRYLKYQAHNLKEARIYGYSAGYANEGEYHHFWELLYTLGEQLNSEC